MSMESSHVFLNLLVLKNYFKDTLLQILEKVSLRIRWMPFDGTEDPFTADFLAGFIGA